MACVLVITDPMSKSSNRATAGAPLHRFSCGSWPAINDGHTYNDKIGKGAAGMNVLEYYRQNHSASGSPQQWQQRVANGQITYAQSGHQLTADAKLRVGDRITYHRLPWAEPDAPAYFDVLWEDEHVLAVSKPAGLQVLPKGLFCQRSVLGLLQLYHQQHRSLRYPDSLVPVPVHRLGRGTSGALLCACTPTARRQLTQDFSTSTEMGVASAAAVGASPVQLAGCATSGPRPLGKKYRALTSGVIEVDEGEVAVPIGLVSYTGLGTGLHAASSSGKPACSLYKVLERREDSTVVEVTILTGRPHQIRIHMAALGHPLAGDPLYGPGGVPKDSAVVGANLAAAGAGAHGDAEVVMPGDCGYCLHSLDLTFNHPVTGAEIQVTAPIPALLQTSADKAV